jgi:hypothetical protein
MATLLFKDHPVLWHTGSDYTQVPLTKVSWDNAPDLAVAWVYFGHVNIDYDGSPTAYAPPGHQPLPDDDLGNAFNDTQGWFGVVAFSPTHPLVKNGTVTIDPDPNQLKQGLAPVLQTQKNGDPKPGYYVSASPRATGPIYLQDSHIDASKISWGALSGPFRRLGVDTGDYGLAIRHNQPRQSGFYFADAGAPDDHALGECSHHVGLNLGGTGRGKYFGNEYPVSFIVFPGSGTIDTTPPPRDGYYDEEQVSYALGQAGIPSISDDDLLKAIRPLLVVLAQADNAEDLALLMGFNEVPRQHRPRGTSKLAAFKQNPGRGVQPLNHQTILQGLRNWGFLIPPQRGNN